MTALVTLAVGFLLAYQAITNIVQGNYVMGENYMGQPVGPGLQLTVCLVALVVGVILAWQYFHPKPQSGNKKKTRSKPLYSRWPHDIP